jgi:glycine betaine/choline ABC-type transport system substrate-binding protein
MSTALDTELLIKIYEIKELIRDSNTIDHLRIKKYLSSLENKLMKKMLSSLNARKTDSKQENKKTPTETSE